MKIRAPVDCDLAGVQSVGPFAQRMRRQLHRGDMGAELHSAPVQRLDMHRPERLRSLIAHSEVTMNLRCFCFRSAFSRSSRARSLRKSV
jgi:hypothetical protein